MAALLGVWRRSGDSRGMSTLSRLALLAALASAGLGPASVCAQSAPTLLEVELRWVEQSLPGQAGALSSAGLPRGAGTTTTAPPHAGIRPAGPVLRVQSGATAVWQLQPPSALQLLAHQPLRDGRGTQVTVPLWGSVGASAPSADWRLEATPTLLRKGQVSLRLSWQQPQPEGQTTLQTTLPLRLGHWTVVARSPAPPLPEPGTLRSSDTVHPIRELQVRVNPVLNPNE